MRLAMCAVALFGASLGAGQSAARGGAGFGSSSSTMPASAVTLVTWVLHSTEQGADPGLLVIWRGSPGWFFANGSPQRSSGGGSRDGYSATMNYGGVDLSLVFKARPRSVIIQDKIVNVGTDTVVLVDDVDGVDGPRVVGTLRVDLSGVSGRIEMEQLGRVLSQSPEAAAFLKCDVLWKGSGPYATLTPVCRAIAGRQRPAQRPSAISRSN
ncbi:MAG TPA: hypothetical protein PKW63_03250 [Vicinamibacterales bacterium]|nr:hypothetical protein [Vicinamibacterales bacterium]